LFKPRSLPFLPSFSLCSLPTTPELQCKERSLKSVQLGFDEFTPLSLCLICLLCDCLMPWSTEEMVNRRTIFSSVKQAAQVLNRKHLQIILGDWHPCKITHPTPNYCFSTRKCLAFLQVASICRPMGQYSARRPCPASAQQGPRTYPPLRLLS